MLRIMRTCTVCGEQFEHEQRAGRPPTTCGKASCRRVRKTRQTEESRTRMSEKDCPPAKHGTATGYT